jgi:hypothetical protein
MESDAAKKHMLNESSGRKVRPPGNRLIELFQVGCIVLGLLASCESYADRRMSVVDDPRGYINVVGLFEDGSRIETRINQGDFFSGNYSRTHGYIGCAQIAAIQGSVCGSTDGGQREISILAINVEHDPDSTECVRERSEDFDVFYRCPYLVLPMPTCKPRDEGGWKYADCELIGDDIIRELYKSGNEVRVENLYAQQEAVKKFNDGLRDFPVEVPYTLLGGYQTLEQWIIDSCCNDGVPGMALLDQAAQPVEQSAPQVEQPQQVVEQPEPQAEQPSRRQKSDVSKPFPHKKVRLMAVTSAGVIILLVLLVAGTAYMRSRDLA